jgi:hypothetical protein
VIGRLIIILKDMMINDNLGVMREIKAGTMGLVVARSYWGSCEVLLNDSTRIMVREGEFDVIE